MHETTACGGVCLRSVQGQLLPAGLVLVMLVQNCPLKEGEVAGVHCYTVVVVGVALLNQFPPPLLLQHA